MNLLQLKIAKILPKSQGQQLEQLWLEFDSVQTNEAKFIML